MKARKMAVLLAGAALVAALGPIGAQAKHCQDVFVFSGVATGQENPALPGTDIRQGLNNGAHGCNVDSQDETFDTNVVTPGSTHLWVGWAGGEDPENEEAVVQFDDGAPITVKMVNNEVRGRWESVSVPIPVGASIVLATVNEQTIQYIRVV